MESLWAWSKVGEYKGGERILRAEAREVGRARSSRSPWPWQEIWILNTVTWYDLYLKNTSGCCVEIELVEPIMEARRFRKLAEVVMKYDTGLHLDDGSGNEENQAVF